MGGKRVALSIAGSDSGGNAGIQADLRAFQVLGVHGCTAICALTAQNPSGVAGIHPVPPEFLGMQIDAVLSSYAVTGIKTGMLATEALIGIVAERLRRLPAVARVVDPVMVATSGARLLEERAVQALQDWLLPLATLMTPNLPETEVLLGRRVRGLEDAAAAARDLHARFGCAVLVKGGHEADHRATDILHDGRDTWRISTPVVSAPLSTHGTGCALSAAIAGALACGSGLRDAVVTAKAYVWEAIRTGVRVGPDAAVMGTPAYLPIESVVIESIEVLPS